MITGGMEVELLVAEVFPRMKRVSSSPSENTFTFFSRLTSSSSSRLPLVIFTLPSCSSAADSDTDEPADLDGLGTGGGLRDRDSSRLDEECFWPPSPDARPAFDMLEPELSASPLTSSAVSCAVAAVAVHFVVSPCCLILDMAGSRCLSSMSSSAALILVTPGKRPAPFAAPWAIFLALPSAKSPPVPRASSSSAGGARAGVRNSLLSAPIPKSAKLVSSLSIASDDAALRIGLLIKAAGLVFITTLETSLAGTVLHISSAAAGAPRAAHDLLKCAGTELNKTSPPP
mmetsp:Transcript_1751/g.3953  ORF Transcript_1751/g.3953 Transcript_1751/m.3953 type:complete len:287 (+) Transcript_1751:215-1075(+)